MRLGTKSCGIFPSYHVLSQTFRWHVQYSGIMSNKGLTHLNSNMYTKQFVWAVTDCTHIRNLLLQNTTQAGIIFTCSESTSFLKGLQEGGGHKHRKMSCGKSLNVSQNARKQQKIHIIHFPRSCMKIINK